MPLLYAVIARNTTVLTKYATCAGNFEDVTEHILAKIPPHDDKLTYSQGPYLFHYISENKIVYLCISDDDFQRSRAFLFLNEIKRRFQATYGDGVHTALPYAMNTEFSSVLANEMKHYSTSKDIDRLSQVHGELDELKDIMVRNIDNIAMRGERLELLVYKTENLTASSVTFNKTSRNLARSLFWKSVKLYVIVAGALVLVIYFIISMCCGGFAWQKCVGN